MKKEETTIPTGVTLEDCFEAREREETKPSFLDVFVGWLMGLLMGAVIFILASAVCGCVYKGAKVTEGTDFALGINVPTAEGTFQFDLINYLSGFRLGVAENARLEVKYTHSETNEYFGCVTTRTFKTVDATVEPCEVSEPATDLGEVSPSDEGNPIDGDVGDKPSEVKK